MSSCCWYNANARSTLKLDIEHIFYIIELKLKSAWTTVQYQSITYNNFMNSLTKVISCLNFLAMRNLTAAADDTGSKPRTERHSFTNDINCAVAASSDGESPRAADISAEWVWLPQSSYLSNFFHLLVNFNYALVRNHGCFLVWSMYMIPISSSTQGFEITKITSLICDVKKQSSVFFLLRM